MLDLLDEACRRYENRPAIDLNGVILTYGELDRAANRLANYLIDNYVSQGSIVAVLLEDRVEIIITLIALLRSGSVFVPFDLHHPKDRLRTIVTELAPDCLIASLEGESFAADVCHEIADSRVITVGAGRGVGGNNRAVHLKSRLEAYSDSSPGVTVGPDDLCYIFYTSGSTGEPKGIMGRYKSLTHFIRWEMEIFNVCEGQRVSQFTTHTFDAFLRDVLVPLCAGGTICIPPKNAAGMSANELLGWIVETKLNLIHCVPSLFRFMLTADLQRRPLHALRYILMAGETLQVPDVRKWMDVYGDSVTLVNLYGSTETTMVKFYHVVEEADLSRGFIPIGKPMKGAKAILLDETGHVCSQGASGEIYIRTPYLTLGYYKKPGLTAEVFVKNPLSVDPSDIIYKTGDLARKLSDGSYQFLGRKDHLVKIRGFRVELGEVESQLRNHDGVASVAVAVYEKFSGENQLAAYVVAGGEQPPSAAELRSYLRARLPEYMVPSSFVFMKEIPLTSNGKLDRRKLPTPDSRRTTGGGHVEPPRTGIEERLAQIWTRLLNLSEVGVYDNFFDLGGHSLLAPQLTSLIHEEFHLELPLIQLFESPTIAGLAGYIAASLGEDSELAARKEILEKYPALLEIVARVRRTSSEADETLGYVATRSPLTSLHAQGARPPFFCVHPISGGASCYLDLARGLNADRPFYGLQARGLSGEEEPYVSVEKMAENYIAAIRTIQPEGPYYIGGWSFGGLVAFEMARTLRAEGQLTEVLALIDTGLSLNEKSVETDDASLLWDLFHRVLDCSQEQLRCMNLDEQLLIVLNRLKVTDLAPQTLGLPWFRAYFNVYRANNLAKVRYQAAPYDGPVSLFIADERPAQAGYSQTLGWERVVRGSIETQVISGNHTNIITRPYVYSLADRLRNCLGRFD